jgi:DNA-3-methyladenine glycosylase
MAPATGDRVKRGTSSARADAPRCDRRFYTTDAATLARRLLGQRLVRILDDGTRLAGIIVETEAYLGVHDLASHASGGRRTPRNEAMYALAGTSYVYFTYGMHHCFNIVCGQIDEPAAVLIRAMEVTDGEDYMRKTLARDRRDTTKISDLCRGPGRLCRSLVIDRELNARDLTMDASIWVERLRGRAFPQRQIVTTARIGIDSAGAWRMKPLRFFVEQSNAVSGPRTRKTSQTSENPPNRSG